MRDKIAEALEATDFISWARYGHNEPLSPVYDFGALADAVLGLLRQGPTVTVQAQMQAEMGDDYLYEVGSTMTLFPQERYALVELPEEDG